ncbi:uncharacterized protein N7459_006649 [Penicillium hispanicum]|uniref:uncharacterized protein n=1 Tax=Penicillium hispanicum TaxID=1080232 RepID=UPI002540F81F|nr:uncharacterized protein N7459_006649 [Penicillium hispanicum]KAJ5577685.1 hypothetical protein N7459_006649 [Penicillium hispanicum]
MPSYAPLTQGLKHVRDVKELEPGETYLVRFKNSQREYKTDLWVAVIIPEGFGSTRNLNRRPKGARPEDGKWTTPLSERVYPIYIPGRNSYRWTQLNDLFQLEKDVPAEFASYSKRNDAKLFRTLHRIANQNPTWEFWESMANTEMQAKGKRKKNLSLVLPEGYEDTIGADIYLQGEASDYDEPGSSQSVATRAERPSDTRAGQCAPPGPMELEAGTVLPPKKVQHRSVSFSASRFPGESSSFLSYVTYGKSCRSSDAGPWNEQKNRTVANTNDIYPAVVRRTQLPSFPSYQDTVFSSRDIVGEQKPKIEDELDVNPFNEKEKTSIFDLTMRMALEHIFLHKEEAVEILAVFHDMVEIQGRPEAEHIQSFLIHKEFSPRLVSLNAPFPTHTSNSKDNRPTDEEVQYEVGDCYRMQRQWKLEAVGDSDNLQKQIISLGRLYLQARRFKMDDLIHLITRKLQAAWNSYPGLCQLEPLMDVTTMAFSDPSVVELDELQTWLINFIADTLDLFFYVCSEQFWAAMRENPALHHVVFRLRKEFLQENPNKYSDPRLLIQSRGINQL